METPRQNREDVYKNRLLSSNDHVRNWYFRWKNMKECILTKYDDELLEKEKKRKRSVNQIENIQPKRENEKQKNTTHSKLSKKGLIYLDLKPLKTNKTLWYHPEPQKVAKKNDSDTSQRETSVVDKTLPDLQSTWEHTGYSVVLNSNLNRLKKSKGNKPKHEKTKKSSKASAELKGRKKLEILWNKMENEKDKSVAILYRHLNGLMTNPSTDTGGEAVVIYQRQDRRDFFHPSPGDGCHYKHISFSERCEETIDYVQSKRSLSQPLNSSTKKLLVARRRTRYFMDPQRSIQTQSDFHSAIDFLKHGGSLGFNPFGSSLTKIIYKHPFVENKDPFHQLILRKSKSHSRVSTGFRLRQTAEKKLDLYRELVRMENDSKKKFWESIEKSLNYRCAVAQMFSSRSFLSMNETSDLTESTRNRTRSTNFYLSNSYVEEISSFQGFDSDKTSTKTDLTKKTKPGNVRHLSYSTIQRIKEVLDTILVKETEEEGKTFLKKKFESSLNIRSSNHSTTETDISPFDTSECQMSEISTRKFSKTETDFWSDDTNAELEFLMKKLSEEIHKYSTFIKCFNETTAKKLLPYSSAKLSASDSKIALNKDTENDLSQKTSYVSKKAVYPVFIYPTCQTSPSFLRSRGLLRKNSKLIKKEKNPDTGVKIREKSDSERPPVSESNDSILHFEQCSLSHSKSTEKNAKVPTLESSCCQDCKLLKQRIIKLEEDLDKIQRIMTYAPKKDQDRLNYHVRSFNNTSDVFLKKLLSLNKLRYEEDLPRKNTNSSKRSKSAPGPIVHHCRNDSLSLEPEKNECKVNVAMGITMENVDPLTGKKLLPDENWENEQQGNIQCKMYKNDEDPVMVMNTNFSYNPKTGMLFSKIGNPPPEVPTASNTVTISSQKTLPETVKKPELDCLVLPVQPEVKKSCDITKTNSAVRGNSLSVKFKDGVELINQDAISKIKKVKSEEKEKKTKKKEEAEVDSVESSESCKFKPDLSENKLEPKDSKKIYKLWFGKSQTENCISRIPIRRKATPSSPNSKYDPGSPKSSMTSVVANPPPSESLPSTPKTPETPKKNPENGKKVKKPSISKKNSACKSSQTFEKPEIQKTDSPRKPQTSNVGLEAKHEIKDCGIQASATKRNEGTQTYHDSCGELGTLESEVEIITSSACSLKSPCPSEMTYTAYKSTTPTINDGVQTDGKKTPRLSKGIQTNLPTEEQLKYINDLQIQKRVNLAIAELCFHVTQTKNQQEAKKSQIK